MHIHQSTKSLLGAFTVIIATMVLVTGVTFAALQSQEVTLQSSTITSATASLQLSNGSGAFGSNATGFAFTNIEPGSQLQPVAGHIMTLRNNGSTKLSLRLGMRSGNFSATPQTTNIDRVYVAITPVGSSTMQEFSLLSLMQSYSNGTSTDLGLTIPAGQDVQYKLQAQIASDVVSSATDAISLSGIDLVFSGTSVAG